MTTHAASSGIATLDSDLGLARRQTFPYMRSLTLLREPSAGTTVHTFPGTLGHLLPRHLRTSPGMVLAVQVYEPTL
jgi:hypothetical protein